MDVEAGEGLGGEDSRREEATEEGIVEAHADEDSLPIRRWWRAGGGRDQLETHCTIEQAAREKIWTGPP